MLIRESRSSDGAGRWLSAPSSITESPLQKVEKLQEKFLEFRFHVLAASAFGVAIFYILRLGPSFFTVLSFFKPLLLSTSVFLAAVLVFRLISPLPEVAMSEETGEEFMNFVGRHGQTEEAKESNHEVGEIRDSPEEAESAPGEMKSPKT